MARPVGKFFTKITVVFLFLFTGFIFSLDPPTNGSVTINSNDFYVNTINVNLSLYAVDATSINISNTDFGAGVTESYATNKSWSLVEGDGQKTVYTQFINESGNINASDTITLDTTAPNPGVLTVRDMTNGSGQFTNGRIVSVNISGESDGLSGIAKYYITENNSAPGLDDPAWQDKPVTYNILSNEGPVTLYLFIKDNAANISTHAFYTITLDLTVPVIDAFTIKDKTSGNENYTNEIVISVDVTEAGVSASYGYYISGNASAPNGDNNGIWINKPDTFTLSNGDAVKTVYLWVRDEGGNTAGTSRTITLDTTSPDVTSITLTDQTYANTNYSNAALININIA
ncbi:MAG: hypothetical protein PHV30_01780, partial [Candidatus Margulisbacteria bacterium]|nr:hypothetical protein [Candidatus Margulisiibacteriota bacterium]